MIDKSEILLVGAHPNFLNKLIRIFEVDFHVVSALGPMSAIEALSELQSIRVIIADVEYKTMDCIEFYKHISERFPQRDFYKIVYAVSGDENKITMIEKSKNDLDAFVRCTDSSKFIIHAVKQGLKCTTV